MSRLFAKLRLNHRIRARLLPGARVSMLIVCPALLVCSGLTIRADAARPLVFVSDDSGSLDSRDGHAELSAARYDHLAIPPSGEWPDDLPPPTIVEEVHAESNSAATTSQGGSVEGSWDQSDEFWIVSSRAAKSSPAESPEAQGLEFWRLEDDSEFAQAEPEEFFTGFDDAIPTIVYVHGNRVEAHQAEAIGRKALATFASHSATSRRFRFVLWSWPSGRAGLLVRDTRVKAHRSDVHSYYLAWVVGQLPSSTPVALVGYSFGARLVGGAMHLLGGGSLLGRTLPPSCESAPSRLRVTLLAAALDNHWLLPGKRYGHALGPVERMLVLSNRRDPALKRYPWIDPWHGSNALGYTGLFAPWLAGESLTKIQQVDVSHVVGPAHDEMRYLTTPVLHKYLGSYVFFDEQDLLEPTPRQSG